MCVQLSCEGGWHCLTMGVGTLSCNGWELFLYMGWGSVFVMTRTATCRGGGIHCLAMCVQLSCEWGRALPDHGCDLGLYCVEPCAWSCRGWATVSYLVQHSPARNGGGPSSSGLDMALCWNGWLSFLDIELQCGWVVAALDITSWFGGPQNWGPPGWTSLGAIVSNQ